MASIEKTSVCPSCDQPVEREKTSAYPFCSERCRLVDLSKWLDGDYTIPEEPTI